VLDAGALIGVERADRRVIARLDQALASLTVVLPTTVWAQVWRGGARQARLGRPRQARGLLLAPLTMASADEVGALLRDSATSDVVDAHVVVVARHHDPAIVLTSDPDDLRRLDPALRLVAV